jgi:3-hydroxyisobutyrate dehydrogenase
MNARQRVGFVGLGIMGSRMARNLAEKGFSVEVWNRTAFKARSLERYGVTVASALEELAERVEVVCTCVTNPPARLLEVVQVEDLCGEKLGL